MLSGVVQIGFNQPIRWKLTTQTKISESHENVLTGASPILNRCWCVLALQLVGAGAGLVRAEKASPLCCAIPYTALEMSA